jgi:hypothetical protein
MQKFFKQRARWAAVLYSLILLSLLLVSCATAPSSRKYVGPVFDSKPLDGIEESFPNLWEKWTVQLGGAPRSGIPWLLGSPFAMSPGEGRGGRGSEFPLQIAATLMDSTLIEAGLQHYANLIQMTQEERAAFRRAYFDRYNPTYHLLIWCELRTGMAEDYLNLDRWTVFIEDDAINQYEPVQILEEPQSAHRTAEHWLPGFQPGHGRRRWEVHQKSLMLFFPNRDFYQNPVLSHRVKFLKLVFQLNEDEKTKAEGIWVLKK